MLSGYKFPKTLIEKAGKGWPACYLAMHGPQDSPTTNPSVTTVHKCKPNPDVFQELRTIDVQS